VEEGGVPPQHVLARLAVGTPASRVADAQAQVEGDGVGIADDHVALGVVAHQGDVSRTAGKVFEAVSLEIHNCIHLACVQIFRHA
jgi:hypothetical protein